MPSKLAERVQPADATLDVLIVASWFPAYDDLAAGRFVADQAEALATTGVTRPAVVSFDGVRLSGGARSRAEQEAVVVDDVLAAIRRAEPIFVTPAWGVDPGVPVARLSIPDGPTRTTGPEHAVIHREQVLRELAEWVAPGMPASGESGRPVGAGAAEIRRGVVHAHTVYPDGAAAAALADRLGWPLVITEHSSFVDRIVAAPALRTRYEVALHRAHAVLAVSDMLANELRASFPSQAHKIAVLPNAVPVSMFVSRPLNERVADELLFVGYRKSTKGIATLLQAVAIAHSKRPSITLRLVGRSPDEATEAGWKTLAEELGIGGIVSFEPPADRAAIAEAMARASIFVHPSPRETFGVVAVEALASGLPVVATDSGGVSEILGPEPDAVGAVVPVDDPDALAAAVLRALERRTSFDPTALREAVDRRFGAAFVTERLLLVYREAIEANPSASAQAPAPAPAIPRDARESSPDVSIAAGLPERTLVVALDRRRAALRLGPLPEELRSELLLVTATEPSDVDLPHVGRVIEVGVVTDPKPRLGADRSRHPGLAGRLARFVRNPVVTIQDRLGRGMASGLWLRPAADVIEQLVAGTGHPLIVLPLDGHDHLAIAPVVARGRVKLSSGGLRRLADLWLASRGGAGADPRDHSAST